MMASTPTTDTKAPEATTIHSSDSVTPYATGLLRQRSQVQLQWDSKTGSYRLGIAA